MNTLLTRNPNGLLTSIIVNCLPASLHMGRLSDQIQNHHCRENTCGQNSGFSVAVYRIQWIFTCILSGYKTYPTKYLDGQVVLCIAVIMAWNLIHVINAPIFARFASLTLRKPMVSIGSDNRSLPDDIKPLLETLLAYYQRCFLIFNWEQFSNLRRGSQQQGANYVIIHISWDALHKPVCYHAAKLNHWNKNALLITNE